MFKSPHSGTDVLKYLSFQTLAPECFFQNNHKWCETLLGLFCLVQTYLKRDLYCYSVHNWYSYRKCVHLYFSIIFIYWEYFLTEMAHKMTKMRKMFNVSTIYFLKLTLNFKINWGILCLIYKYYFYGKIQTFIQIRFLIII